MTGYVRQSAADIVPTAVVRAAPINNELNALRDAFVANGGHRHDGTAAEGHPVPVMGDSDLMNKIATDTSNNRHGVFVEVGGAAVEQVRFQDGVIAPVTTNDIDLGTSSVKFKDLHIAGVANLPTANITSANIDGGTVDGAVIGGSSAAAGSFTTIGATGAITSTVSTGTAPLVIASTTKVANLNVDQLDGADWAAPAAIGTSTPAAGTFTSLTANTSLVAATADINGGTLDGAVIGASSAQAITGTTVTATTGFVGGLTGNVTGNTTGTHTGAVIGNVTGDVTGNVTASSGSSTFNDVVINGGLNMNAGTSATITNLTSPTNTNDAATKGYVDTSIANLIDSAPGALDTLNELAAALGDDASFSTTVTNSIATKLALAGGTMSGAIAMGTNKITGLGNPTANQDAATKTYVDTADALKLSLTGGTMSGAIAMGTSKITGLGDPTANQDAATKIYVDGILGSATSAAASAAAAATSASNAATSASNASTSASNASTSASSALTYLNTFKGQYYGSLASNPTLDPLGNAIGSGDLYWNTAVPEMRVYNGTAWVATYLPTAGYATLTGTETLTNKTISTVDQTKLQYATSVFPAIKPSLLLDFANTKQLDPRITFTRASTATFYDGVTTAKAEENLLLQSQAFETGSWTKTRATVTADSTTAPDGTTTADSLLQQAGQTSAGFARTPSLSVNALEYVLSIFAKPNGKNFLMIQEELLDGTQNRTWFNVSTGTVGTTDPGHVATITASNNGFYRCSIRFTVNAQRTGLLYFYVSDADNSTTVADDSLGLYLWGAQLEQRSAVSAYTATTTQPITNYIPALQTAAAGVARFEHNPVTGESLGLEIEEQRTNLLLQSETFSTTWVATRCSITANTIVAPDGALTADKLVEDATASDTHLLTQSISFTSGTAYTYSIFAKQAEAGRFFQLLFPSAAFGSALRATFDLTNGTFQVSASITGAITFVGNGWYRCSITGTATTTASASIGILLANSSSATGVAAIYTGDGYSGIYIWGAQLEAGAFATSYIPTTTAQVTRAADAASMTGTNFSSWYRADEGTFYAEFAPASSNFGSNKNIFLASDGTVNNYNGLRYTSSGSQPANSATVASIVQSNILSGTMVAGTWYKMAGAYKVNDFAMSRDAGTVGTDTSGTLPVVTQAEIGVLAGTNISSQMIKKLAYYPLRVTNAQLQALTS